MKRLSILIIGAVFLSACSAGPSEVALNPFSCMNSDNAQTAAPVAGDTIATITTNLGEIKLKLFPELVPETAKNFEELAGKGFYNGLVFHRVIPNFMIQGGDPRGDGTGGESYKGPGTNIPDEFTDDLGHLCGALSMANAGPNTGSSQFFIVHAKEGTRFLDGRHAVFGQIYEGMDVVNAIAITETDAADRPLVEMKMEKVVVEKKT
jgi:peptidyl-prolyl cis-trans isomerase B (cyclophilin B)